jgi:hypothetical protein
MTITGEQLKAARELLGWSQSAAGRQRPEQTVSETVHETQ